MTSDLHIILGDFNHKNKMYVSQEYMCLKKLDYMFKSFNQYKFNSQPNWHKRGGGGGDLYDVLTTHC